MNENISTKPLVSVVIPTLNSAKIIEECLESIKKQTYPNIEIIVVDGHSTDNTLEIAKKYGRTFSYGPDQSKGRVFGGPYQRNFGVSKANGKCIYYVDSDMRLMPQLVEECVSKIEKEQADAVIVPEFSYGEGFWAHCRVLEKSCYNDDDLVDAARFVRKEVWDKLGGLDVTLGGGDDWDFQLRLNKNGHKTVRVKNYVRHYEGKLSLCKQLRKKYLYGKTVDRYFKKYSNRRWMLVKQYSLFRPAYFRNWKKFLRDPIHGLGLIVMKSFEYAVAFMGTITSKLGTRDGDQVNLV